MELLPVEQPEAQAPEVELPQPSFRLTRDRLLSRPVGDRLGMLESYFQQRVSRILGMGISKLPLHESLCNVGLDSLMVLELKHNIETDLNLSLSMTEFLHCPSIAQLASLVLMKLTPLAPNLNLSWEEGEL
jgi:acyl carrier protein